MSDTRSPATLVEAFCRWEASSPDRVYMTQPVGGQVTDFTWRQTGDQARRMAGHLAAMNLPPRSRIALLSKNCAQWIMADLAIWMAGHVSVPLYPTGSAETVGYIIDHCDAKLLFVGKLDDWATMRAGVPAGLPTVALPLCPPAEQLPAGCRRWDDVVATTAPLAQLADWSPDEMATIKYTSGSTGKPKGVMISHKAMLVAANAASNLGEVSQDERMLSYLPLAHAFERALVLAGSLRFGFHVYFADSLETFVEDLRRARPTLFQSVPRLWVKFQRAVDDKLPERKLRLLLKLPIISGIVKRKVLTQLGLADARIALTGSAPLPASVIAWYRSLGLELLEGYGMTENFAYSHLSLPGQARLGYVGHAQAGVETRIAENGEIQVKSPGSMLGYYREEQMTRDAFTDDGFLKTGDMGEIDAAGRLKITGRVKELFKTSKGKYVAPVPVEHKLGHHPRVEAVCVAGANQPQPHALVMLSEDTRKELAAGADRAQIEAELKALLDATNAQLEHHEQLQFVVVVRDPWTIENGFLTPTMKLKRNVIENRYADLADGWYASRKKVIWQ